jgi:hypothetical protein
MSSSSSSMPREKLAPAAQNHLADDDLPAIERHRRKCKICNHPERDIIEADFLDWCNAEHIARDFKVSYSSIYRHARVVGLVQRRRQNLCPAVEKIIESVAFVDQPSAYVILRAVRTLACLTGARQWTEPHTTHVIVNSTEPPAQSPNALTASDAPAESVSPSSRTEPDATKSTLTLQGEWNGSSSDSRCPAREPSSLQRPASGLQNPNRHTYEKLESHISPTK